MVLYVCAVTKSCMYKGMVKPVLMYALETADITKTKTVLVSVEMLVTEKQN